MEKSLIDLLLSLKSQVDNIGKYKWRIAGDIDEGMSLLTIAPDRELSLNEVHMLETVLQLDTSKDIYYPLKSHGNFNITLFLDVDVLRLFIGYDPELDSNIVNPMRVPLGNLLEGKL